MLTKASVRRLSVDCISSAAHMCHPSRKRVTPRSPDKRERVLLTHSAPNMGTKRRRNR